MPIVVSARLAEALAVIGIFFLSFAIPKALLPGFHPPHPWLGICVCSLMVVHVALRGQGALFDRGVRPWSLASAWLQSIGVALFLVLASIVPAGSVLPHQSLAGLKFAGTDAAGLIVWVCVFPVVSYLAVILVRLLGRPIFAACAQQRRIVIVGGAERCSGLVHGLRQALLPSMRIVGIVDHEDSYPANEVAAPTANCGLPVLGQRDDLLGMIRKGEVDIVILAAPWLETADALSVMRLAQTTGVDVLLAPFLDNLEVPMTLTVELGGVPLMRASYPSLLGWQAPLKRAQDVFFAGLLLVLAAPAMIAISVIVKLTSPGPILFRQLRVGYNGQAFAALKFRTMFTHLSDLEGAAQTRRGDHRITPVGAWLRRRSLDELPQLLNVLRGDMSLVGPRPHAVGTKVHGVPLDQAAPAYRIRQRVKPGLTGWAQINGSRGPLHTAEEVRNRVRLDLEYIRNWSIAFDLRIIWRTVRVLLHDKNAF
jgi:exopolysaccharide biosynthesis polyprenyl glycosylphosphotransferase